MFCALEFVFGGTEGVGSHFHVLRPRARFRRYRGRRVPLSCFALPDSLLAVPSASGPVFMFCATRVIFGSTEGVDSSFHVLRSRYRFWRYRGRRFPFKCFALPDSFSAVLRASDLVFTFCASGLVFYNTEGVGSRFHVLRSRTHFRRYRGRRFPLSYFALPDLFSVVPRASGPVFMFCAPGLVDDVAECAGSYCHLLRSRTRFRRCRVRWVLFS
jgi:hypothetical protein